MGDKLVEIVNVEPLEGRRVRLTFDDGIVKIVDVGKLVDGSMFEADFNLPEVFNAVQIYPYGHGIYWPNEFDLCPEMLRYYAEGEILHEGQIENPVLN
ncbi:MAG TPA: DUF2442 domain-containing protein [Candidatus Kapabacteria bacterium]